MPQTVERPRGLLTLLQAMTVLVMTGGTLLAGWLALFGTMGLILVMDDGGSAPGLALVTGGLATVAAVSVCCYVALGTFLALLGRMKRETAFTPRNCRALSRMALCCLIAAGVLLVMMLWLGVGSLRPMLAAQSGMGATMIAANALADVIGLLVWPFCFFVVALLIQGVALLMRRATALEQEQEGVV